MTRSYLLTTSACATFFLASVAEGVGDNGENLVAKRYFCITSEGDAGDQTLEADGPTCEASRAAIEEDATNKSGDPCTDGAPTANPPRFTDPDKAPEEIQVTGARGSNSSSRACQIEAAG